MDLTAPRKDDKANDDMIFQKMLKTRTILLSGEVNKELSEKIIRNLILMESESDTPISIMIDSPGGDADSGFAIFDMIRFIKVPVHTIGVGLVASAAALILLAVPRERRIALPNSHYLIHQPLSGMRGVATEIEIHAKEVAKLKAKINKLIAEETKRPLNKVSRETERDYWLDAEEAVAYGLVDKIVTTREEFKSLKKSEK